MPSTLEPSSRSSKTARTRATTLLGADAAELLPHGLGPAPHLRGLDAARAPLAQDELALDARLVEQLQRAMDDRGRGGVAELVRDQELPVPVVVRVRQGIARDHQGRRIDVAVLLHAQVELQVRPVGRQGVDDLLEMVGERHDQARSLPMTAPDPEDPLAPARGQSLDGLLALLEQLDGREEAAVVRSALAAGVAPERVLDELQREVERRLLRSRQFYDETQW